eukprot:jgi/Tetstr1/457212/TSEL_043860.t1
MPTGSSSHASAATTRVPTQLQNLESEVNYLLKRATERCWREVVNMQKEVENKELRSQLAAEERARVEADILRRKRDRKVARLKARIRLMCESNGSEAESAGSEGSGSDEEGGGQKPGRGAAGRPVVQAAGGDDPSDAEQQQHQGDVDAHEADGEEAGIVEGAGLEGQPVDRLINLSSSKWDADMEKPVQMVLPYGSLMIKWPSVEDMLKGQGEELAAVGLSTTEDMISSSSWCFRIVPGYYYYLGTGHVAKVKREKHEQTHASLKRKFPENTFNTSRAAKK